MKTEAEKRESAFAAMALTVPAAEAAVGKNWLPVLIVALAAWLLCSWTAGERPAIPGWLSGMRIVTMVLLIAWILERTSEPWPGRGSRFVVPLVLLAIAAVSVRKGAEQAAAAAGVLRYGIYSILAVLMVAGLGDIPWKSLAPKAELPDGPLTAVMLLPLLAVHRKEQGNPLPIAAILASVVTVGATSLYEYSRGLSIAGAAEHLESLAACAITVGYFGTVSWLLDGCAAERDQSGKRNGWEIFGTAAAAYAVYLLRIPHAPWLYAALELLFWGILPLLAAPKRKLKKMEKDA